MRTINKNLKITQSNYFMGVALHPYEKEFVIDYLKGFIPVMNYAIHQSGRVYMVRIDLRFPEYFGLEHMGISNWAISDFFEVLREELSIRDTKKRMEGNRIHPHNLHYVWVREQAEAEHWHYHAILMLNGHAYQNLGPYDGRNPDCLAFIIQEAWSIALNIYLHEALALVDFPRGCNFKLNPTDSDRAEAIKRSSYLFKVKTKQHGRGYSLFGTSRIK